MNEKFGYYSAAAAAFCTVVFAISMLIPDKQVSQTISFGICILLSWAYVALACAFAIKTQPERKSFAIAGLAFAILYAVFINIVYYTQLTLPYIQGVSEEMMKSLVYTPGTWMFNLDLYGYGLLALSTFFMGLTIKGQNKPDKWLKGLLLAHGIFAPTSILGPVFNMFGDTGSIANNGIDFGVIALEFWCIIFIPIMILGAVYFRRMKEHA